MIQAEALYCTFWLLACWRYLVLRLEVTSWWLRTPVWLRICLQYYSILYAIFGFFIFSSLLTSRTYFDKYGLMDVSTFSLPEDAPALKLALPHWMRALSLGTPLATLGTFVVTSWHIASHVMEVYRHTDGALPAALQRDRVVQVLALPMVYGSMSFRSVIRMWSLFTGHACRCAEHRGLSWEETEARVLGVYVANFQTADLYEAWALYQFAELCLAKISDCLLCGGGQCVSDSPRRVKIGEEQQLLVRTVHRLTAQGVLAFVLVCFLNASYRLAFNVYRTVMAHLGKPEFSQDLDKYFLAMGLVASSEAITNVITVERTFHRQLQDFRPTPKFWSTKILVSLAFIQEAVIGLCYHLSELQQHLLYSSLICYEVFVLSLFHVYAWPADEKWLSQHPASAAGRPDGVELARVNLRFDGA